MNNNNNMNQNNNIPPQPNWNNDIVMIQTAPGVWA
jgi:hypothetical protein